VIPYQATSEFAASYQSVEDDQALVLDDGLERLLNGLHATAAGRRHRVKGEEGGAYVFEIPMDAGFWHVYWDYTTVDQVEIHFIGLVLVVD
jgi:hypothetical protein